MVHNNFSISDNKCKNLFSNSLTIVVLFPGQCPVLTTREVFETCLLLLESHISTIVNNCLTWHILSLLKIWLGYTQTVFFSNSSGQLPTYQIILLTVSEYLILIRFGSTDNPDPARPSDCYYLKEKHVS